MQYRLYWQDLVDRYMDIEAESKEEALKIWNSGEYDPKGIYESDCQTHTEPEVEDDDE